MNASPLIALAKIGQLDLLRAADRDLLIPAAVEDEILAVIADLRRVGLRLDDVLLRQALRQFVGEDWEA